MIDPQSTAPASPNAQATQQARQAFTGNIGQNQESYAPPQADEQPSAFAQPEPTSQPAPPPTADTYQAEPSYQGYGQAQPSPQAAPQTEPAAQQQPAAADQLPQPDFQTMTPEEIEAYYAELAAQGYDVANDPFGHLPPPIKEEIIVEWEAPSRLYRTRNRQVYTTVAAMLFLICLILFFLNQFLLIAVAIALAFMFYVLNTVPPTNIKVQISNYGVRVEKELYFWEELGRFWIEQKRGQPLLFIEAARFPFRLTLVLPEDLIQEALTELMSQVLINQKPEPTYFDQAADWLERMIPLENTSSKVS